MSALPDAGEPALLGRLRRVLSHRVSVGGLTEIVLWLGGVYLTVGLVWSFFHPDGVQRIETQLEQQVHLPAGANNQLAALGEASVLWPVLSIVPSLGCSH
jgi:hypothetical protein